ncbi:hypothetical protein C7999DRAFT_44560 [Corynascus novoguineensis]|uniref:AB hydrolase-1 domain-containing protein n=1 Tax=Corynascus novoguineensis TaxID=1126955 RepID=A0AAN7HIV9_9PEZI|nr:hypothetical protein C7999DRAFT_44560 [Corynascus novoguineensis]
MSGHRLGLDPQNVKQDRGILISCPQLQTADLAKLNVGNVHKPDFNRKLPLEAGKNVLLVGHSSGGWVATQAAQDDIQAKVRKSKGLAGGVIGILYVGALVISVGESSHSFFQPKDGNFVTHPFMTFHKYGADGLGTIINVERFLFNDLDEASAKKWAATLKASPVLTTRLTNDAYSSLPCAYLVLDKDLTLPREYQEGMASLQSCKTGNFPIYHCLAGHSPHLSWTEGLVNTIQDLVEKIQVE